MNLSLVARPGVSSCKLLAKLASGLHKPDNQTTLPPAAVDAFLARLPVGSLPGCGYVADRQLKALEVRRARANRRRAREFD